MKSLRKTGPTSFTYALTHSKTNQSAADRPENYKPLEGLAAEALQAWLTASGIQEGAIFRQVKKGGSVGAPLSAASVRDIVRQRATAAGLPDVYSAHSLRSGFVTEAATQNIPLTDTMAMTGHRSVASVLGYFRASGSNPAASLLDRQDDPA
jgi:integrase